MSYVYRFIVIICLIFPFAFDSFSQQVYKGKVIDASSKAPVAGATIRCTLRTCTCGCASNSAGEFELKPNEQCCRSFEVSSIGYQPIIIHAAELLTVITLQHESSSMEEVVITANKEGVKRSLAPVAISSISSKMIQDVKPVTIDQVLNRVSGVHMVNLGNEQHSMSIRQPMTTKSLFLYLEDGIPIRTTGLFNHNALLEINMAAVKSIEVVKGPSSSLYGSEAIGGVVNFITAAPTINTVAKLSFQGNTIGYKRTDLHTAFMRKKWGFVLSGYYADKRNSFIEYTDFHKANLTARIDYHFTDRTILSNSFTWLDYYSDMTGGIDSARFVNKSFGSSHTFTYRKVKTLRYRSTLEHIWNDRSKSTASLVYRDNTIRQNPAYGIKDDYRRLSNGTWIGKKSIAHGEVNEAGFNSYSLFLQHRQKFNWKNAVLVAGMNVDMSPSYYSAKYIRVAKDTVNSTYIGYEGKDSMLTNYKSRINNYALFANFEFSPVEKLRIVTSLRSDLFHYRFNNLLVPSSYSGSPDTTNNFKRLSVKIGFTYNFSHRTGIYANYSEGFVPPQVTEMYRGVKVPELIPSVFYNYEIGGWAQIIKGKLNADLSVYNLGGHNEIVSVKLDDGSSQNMNAGRTVHKGIELGINANPLKDVSIRISGAYSRHEFVEFIEKGTSYNGNEMNGAPRWIQNAEVWYKPSFIKGLRLGAEWQKLSNYFMDPLNTVKYAGYNVFHFRAGYKRNVVEVWMNMMNLTDRYYAFTSSKSNFGYSYTPGEPRHCTIGISFDLAQPTKNK